MKAGIVAVISILGIAWLGSTFFEAHQAEILGAISAHVRQYPWLFAFALFALSILLYSQAATVAALMGVGLQLGIAPPVLIAMFPAVNGYFFLPTYATIVAAIQFDSTGTTGIGRWVLNHSFMRAGLVTTTVAVITGLSLAWLFYQK
jgi:anaerobic C4-dicarboxylate transporter DcuA